MIPVASPGRMSLGLPDQDCTAARLRRPGSGPFAGRCFLVADDSATSRFLMREMLAPTGASLVLVADGRQAVEAWAAGAFDLLLFDLWMPELDGAAALAEIRARRGAVPAISISADAAPEDGGISQAGGFALHLSKPVRREKLIAAIDGVI